VKDKEILKKVSGIISRQAAKEEGDRELEELDKEVQGKVSGTGEFISYQATCL